MFQIIFGKLFAPIVWLMGVEWSECEAVGTLVGLKVFANDCNQF